MTTMGCSSKHRWMFFLHSSIYKLTHMFCKVDLGYNFPRHGRHRSCSWCLVIIGGILLTGKEGNITAAWMSYTKKWILNTSEQLPVPLIRGWLIYCIIKLCRCVQYKKKKRWTIVRVRLQPIGVVHRRKDDSITFHSGRFRLETFIKC